ncbi:MAG: calcium-binding protein [Pirellulales bacterium]
MSGGPGDDAFNGGSDYDTIVEAGNVNFVLTDTTLKGLGNDTIASIEAALLTGGSGNNTLDASLFTVGDVTLDGGEGNDTLKGGAGNDKLIGGNGNDSLTGALGDDRFEGGAGTDTLIEVGDVNWLLTNAGLQGLGSDTLVAMEVVNLTGGSSNNTLDASAFTAGSVVLDGGAGDDNLIGGSGNDTLKGGDGNDSLTGGAGNDSISGDQGSDTLIETGDVNFVLTNSSLVGLGTDGLSKIERAILTGGAGNNTLDASAFTQGNVILDGGAGNDTIKGGSGDYKLFGGSGSDSIYGGVGNDFIDGGIGDDLLEGQAGMDLIIGGLGKDKLKGGIGSDLLIGGENQTVEAITDSVFGNWSNASLSYSTRVSDAIARLVISDDTEADTLTGEGDIDAFYKGLNDTLTDRQSNETIRQQ